jgi:hypothetical protein
MGDRCHMTIYCRPQDTARFEELGFTTQIFETAFNDGTVEMLDEEANYAHSGVLPTDIPWTGSHHEGSDYGPAELHCLGDGIVHEWQCATQMRDGYIFPNPILESEDFITAIARFHTFHETRNQALQLLLK